MILSSFSKLNTLKFKFFITLIILSVSFSLLISYLWFTRTLRDGEKSSIENMSETLRINNENFDKTLKDANSLTALIAFNKEIQDILSKNKYNDIEFVNDNNKILTYITGLYGYKNYLSALTIYSLTDREIGLGLTISIDTLKKSTLYENIINSDGDVVLIPAHSYGNLTDNELSNDYPNLSISISRPILNNGQVVGVVIADIKCSILIDLLNTNPNNQNTVIMFDNDTGNYIFKPDLTNLGVNIKERDLKSLVSLCSSQKGNFYTNFATRSFLAVYYYSDFSKWTTVGLIPKDILLEGFTKTRNTAISLLMLFIALTVIISYFMSSLLTNNLSRLNKVMGKVNKDNLDISIKITSHDEIGQLYKQFNQMMLRIKGLVESITQAEKDKHKAEIQALQAQINPHFLYNTLNTIQFLSVLQGVENIREVSESLSTLLHINLDNRSFISVKEELQYLSSYLNIQEYKYNNKFAVKYIIEDEVSDFMIPKLLIQPIVENSLQHGIVPKKGPGVIIIKIYKENDLLKVIVQDNGVGLKEEKIKDILDLKVHTKGIGLHNVISRINMNFGNGYGVSILSEENMYTIVELTLPTIKESEINKYD